MTQNEIAYQIVIVCICHAVSIIIITLQSRARRAIPTLSMLLVPVFTINKYLTYEHEIILSTEHRVRFYNLTYRSATGLLPCCAGSGHYCSHWLYRFKYDCQENPEQI